MAIYHKTLKYHEDQTQKRDLTQEDIQFLLELQKEMNTQDTTGTADPRYWVIKGSETYRNDLEPDEYGLLWDGTEPASTTEETIKYLNENILPHCGDPEKRESYPLSLKIRFVRTMSLFSITKILTETRIVTTLPGKNLMNFFLRMDIRK